ncbi:DUF4652 domain-containing protein [Clostridium sp. MB40-C1]|uniref:DUF4652 domain-containing protein n=1 Tax=Clostridium sp. MB40-C1 TaxID=3070996 RepID=UPI0027DEF17A|nr:DUF4652 domain-containing protein [Clostridium sp. MB40-C1]WMJ80384.1 DUF4652 domain-containing protein [Clostridium sp. MB40-C1]
MKNHSAFRYNKGLSFIVCLMLAGNIAVLTGCSKNKVENNAVASQSDTSKNNEVVVENSEEKAKNNNEDTKKDIEKKESNKKPMASKQGESKKGFNFVKHKLDKNKEPGFSTQWKKSTNSKLSACIEGKGPDGNEEGVGKIYVKDLSSNEKWFLELITEDKQNSPKINLEWLDDENIAIIMGMAYGTVGVGGNVYKVNVKTGKTEVLYNTNSTKKQVISMKKANNSLELEVLIYDDDNFENSHNEKKIINLGGK